MLNYKCYDRVNLNTALVKIFKEVKTRIMEIEQSEQRVSSNAYIFYRNSARRCCSIQTGLLLYTKGFANHCTDEDPFVYLEFIEQ